MRVFSLFLLSLFCFATSASDIKIGFIDTNQVITSISIYKSSVEAISNEFEPKKQELLDLFNHIELLRSKINSNENPDSNQSIKTDLSKLSSLEESFKQETEFWQKTMNAKKAELLKEIEFAVNQTINEYAIREKYDLILYENIAFVSDRVNITEEIIADIEKLEL